MKKLILILLCLGLTGCIPTGGTRGVNKEEKFFYSSSNPNIQLKFPNYSEYMELGRGKMKHRFIVDNTTIYIDLVSHPANELKNWTYNAAESWIFNNVPTSEKITHGSLTILGKKWYYCNSLHPYQRSGYFIRNLGYFAPNHNIFYVRFVKKLSYDDFQTLADHEYVTSKQQDLIQEIVQTFNNEVKITKFTQKEGEKPNPNSTTMEGKLKLLKNAYNADLITKDEYLTKKHELLEGL